MHLFIMKICFGIKDYHTSKTGNLWYVWFSRNICLIYSIYAKHLRDYKGGIWIHLSKLNYIIRIAAVRNIKAGLILSFNRPFWVHAMKWHDIDGTTWRFTSIVSNDFAFRLFHFPSSLDIQVQRCLEGIRLFF